MDHTFTPLCEEDQADTTDIVLQEVPFQTYIKCEPSDDRCTESQGWSQHEVQMSPHPYLDVSFLSPDHRHRTCSSRKDRTPNTLRVMMEKHRHSERIRHHTLNERLKLICKQVPGSAEDGRETKVVMMQRIISYIAYLENTIHFFCSRFSILPHPNWLLLTTNTREYFQSFGGTKNNNPTNVDSDEDSLILHPNECTKSLEDLAQDRRSGVPVHHLKVSSPTVDSTTDCVVPVLEQHGADDGVSLSQDSGVPSSTNADDEHPLQIWTLHGDQEVVDSGHLEEFFSSSVDDGISAMFEIPSSTIELKSSKTVAKHDLQDFLLSPGHHSCIQNASSFIQENTLVYKEAESHAEEFYAAAVVSPNQVLPNQQGWTIQFQHGDTRYGDSDIKYMIPPYSHKNKRKQYSPKRSPFNHPSAWRERDECQAYSDGDKIYITGQQKNSCGVTQITNHDSCVKSGINHVTRVLPYNIRCNHRQATEQCVRFTRGSVFQCPLVSISKKGPEQVSNAEEEKPLGKVDLRKTSWMNGFMMYSRLNRRKFIEAHPGVHTSHISKIMGHTWRSMSQEEQAPYREKAKLCSQELYRAYTSLPDVTSSAAASSSSVVTPPLVITSSPPALSLEL